MNLMRQNDIEIIINKIQYNAMAGKTVLITGATGFLASYMVDTLMELNKRLDKRCVVIALCRNKNKAVKMYKEYLKQPTFKLCIQTVEEPIDITENVDYIIHAASSATSQKNRMDPVGTLSSNTVGTRNLLEFAQKKGVDGFLFLSSGAVYGQAPDCVTEIKENDCFPMNYMEECNFYGEGKRVGEALCKAYFVQYGVPVKCARISHTYGPGIDLNDGRVFSDFVNKICKGEDLVITGTGLDVRPFCYISDAVIALFKILIEGKNGEVYNMANPSETVTIYELAERLVKQAFPERNLKIKASNLQKSGDIRKIVVNIDKMKALGWSPQIGIVEGFKRTVGSFEEEL